MKCKLCDQFFVEETTFQSLYRFNELCHTCKEQYKPLIHQESIPYNNGLIEYYYLYDQLILNARQVNYLNRQFKHLFKHMLTLEPTKKTFLIIDGDVLATFKTEAPLILGFPNLILLSVLRCNLENFVFFF